MLYPNDHTTCTFFYYVAIITVLRKVRTVGKELRLKQQYFWTAASLADMMRRFKHLDKPINEFAECPSMSSSQYISRADIYFSPDNAIQLNDVRMLSLSTGMHANG